jgi:hypothetical protein
VTLLHLRFSASRSTDAADQLLLLFGAAGAAPPPPPPPPPLVGQLRAATAVGWASAARAQGPAQAATWRDAGVRTTSAAALPWRIAARRAVALQAGWSALQALPMVVAAAPWHATQLARRAHSAPWRDGRRTQRLVAMPARQAAVGRATWVAGWRAGRPVLAAVAAPWHQGQLARRAWLASAGQAAPRRTAVLLPWQGARHLIVVEHAPWVRPTPLPPQVPSCWTVEPADGLSLLFTTAASAGALQLIFRCRPRPAVAVVPIRRVYMLFNSASLTRVSDGAPVKHESLSLSLDVDTWCWMFSAALPYDSEALVDPVANGGPVVLQVLANGVPVRVAVESVGRERVFGRTSVRATGRGISAALADPYQRTTVFSSASPATSQQLLDQALPAGWTANWGLESWLVPPGAWSHQGTPMTAAQAIAAAGGGYVQPHPTAQQIMVLPRYPAPPWALASLSPDLELPAAIAMREAIDLVQRPTYNRVWVSGTTGAGILGGVTRQGTAGDLEAPMVVDPLITDVAAVRQRGLAVLGDTGRQLHITLRVPVLPITGIIQPGKLLRYTDGGTQRLGLVRAVTLTHDGGPEVWQSVRVESHV